MRTIKRLSDQGRSYSREVYEDCQKRYEGGETMSAIAKAYGGAPSVAVISKWKIRDVWKHNALVRHCPTCGQRIQRL
jgi:hypothetical protein